MKKHYIFIPIKESDISEFKNAAIKSRLLRPLFVLLMMVILGLIGFANRTLISKQPDCLIVFSAAAAFFLFLFIHEAYRLFLLYRLHKSFLLPYIRVRGFEESFYSEELPDGFIIQTMPVGITDIECCRAALMKLAADHPDHTALTDYLNACLTGNDGFLTGKAVIYTEIIFEQLEKGNKDILATYDSLQNFKAD